MTDPYRAREDLLTLIEGILGPDRIDQLRDQLVAELGTDVALPAMRIIRPHLERLRDAQTEEWQSLRRSVRADVDGAARVRALAFSASASVSRDPADCTNECMWGGCDCSGESRPVAWNLDPAEVLAALDQPAHQGGENEAPPQDQ